MYVKNLFLDIVEVVSSGLDISWDVWTQRVSRSSRKDENLGRRGDRKGSRGHESCRGMVDDRGSDGEGGGQT